MPVPPLTPAQLADATGDMGAVIPFPQRMPKPPKVHFCGYLFNRIRLLVTRHNDQESIDFETVAQNHNDGSRKIIVTLGDGGGRYEMTLRPISGGAA